MLKTCPRVLSTGTEKKFHSLLKRSRFVFRSLIRAKLKPCALARVIFASFLCLLTVKFVIFLEVYQRAYASKERRSFGRAVIKRERESRLRKEPCIRGVRSGALHCRY